MPPSQNLVPFFVSASLFPSFGHQMRLLILRVGKRLPQLREEIITLHNSRISGTGRFLLAMDDGEGSTSSPFFFSLIFLAKVCSNHEHRIQDRDWHASKIGVIATILTGSFKLYMFKAFTKNKCRTPSPGFSAP